MTLSLKHAFESAKSDGADTTLVQPSNWNAEHALTLSGPNKAVGRLASGSGSAEEVTIREVLTAARTYYVRTDGNDSNTGLANTAGGAKLTVQGALDAIKQIDFNGYVVTVQIADGTYSASFDVPFCVGQANMEHLVIRGNSTTPANVVIDGSADFAAIEVVSGAKAYLRDFKLISDGRGLVCYDIAALRFRNLDFGASNGAQIFCGANATMTCFNDYAITGSAAQHVQVATGGRVLIEGEVTLTGTPAFTTFADASDTASLFAGDMTFSGSATGARYSVTTNAVINTSGGGANFFPGNAAGSAATGGQYV